MKVFLSILSISMLSTIWLGPGIAGGAQLLSDDELDEVTAAGSVDYSIDFIGNSNLILGTTPTPGVVSTPLGLTSALSSVSAAAAAAEAAKAVSGIAGLAVASDAVSTAATALTDTSNTISLNSLNAGKATLSAAATLLNSVPLEQHTPAIIDAANKIDQAAASLNQAAFNTKAIELNTAVKAVEAVKVALSTLPEIGGEIDHSSAIDAAVKSIQTAKNAINEAAQAQKASGGGSQTAFVLKEGGDGSLDPILRINFNSGRTVGSADIIPLVTRGGPSQPGLDALNLDGAAIAGPNGLLPLTVVAETLMLNMNICYFCRADKIIQTNNGYVVPIYAR